MDSEEKIFLKLWRLINPIKLLLFCHSRKSEIKSLLPIYLKLIENLSIQFNNISFVIPIPENISNYMGPTLNDYKTRVKILLGSKMGVDKFDSLKFSF